MKSDFCQPPEKHYPGSRIGVMLIHGLTGTPTEMTSIARGLNRRGFTVYCPLLPGHCSTVEDLLKTTYRDWIKSTEKALAFFSGTVDVVFTGGLSAGAVLSLKMAQLYPERIRGQALYSTTFKWDGWSIPKLSFLLPLVLRLPYFGKRYFFEEEFPYGIKNEKLRKRVYDMMHSGDPAQAGFPGIPGFSLREMWRLADDVKRDLKSIKTPTLLMHAKDDDQTSAKSNAMYVQERLGGTSTVTLLDDSYHIITIDQEKHKVVRETTQYFYDLLTEDEKKELLPHAKDKTLKPG